MKKRVTIDGRRVWRDVPDDEARSQELASLIAQQRADMRAGQRVRQQQFRTVTGQRLRPVSLDAIAPHGTDIETLHHLRAWL